MNTYLLVLIILTSLLVSECTYKNDSFEFFMPNVTPNTDELTLCTSIKVSKEFSFNIVGFLPKISKGKAHRLILHGCTEPGVYSIISDDVWNCGTPIKEIEPRYKPAEICRSGLQVIYPAWPSDTKGMELPHDVGFSVGENSDIKYLVLQVHYKNKLLAGETDNSGITIYYTLEPLRQRAGLLVLGAHAFGPSKDEIIYTETACKMTEDKTIYPFAYLTHSHALGKEVTAYVVEKDNKSDVWYLLGSNNPQFSTSFSNVSYNYPIIKGNILAARCTLSNFRNFRSLKRLTKTDAICNFYLMYAVKGDSPLNQKTCISTGPPYYDWIKSRLMFNRVPVKKLLRKMNFVESGNVNLMAD